MNRWFPPLLMLVLAALLVLLFSRLESVRTVQHGEPPARVQQNPYLAAIRFLERRELDARHFPAVAPAPRLPATDSLLVLEQGSQRLDQPASAELLDWVLDGGLLVLAVEGTDTPPGLRAEPRHQLLEQLGIELVPGEDPPPDPYRERPFAEHLAGAVEVFWRFCRSEQQELRQQCIRIMCGDPDDPDSVLPDTRMERRHDDDTLRLELNPRWSFHKKAAQAVDPVRDPVRARGSNRHGTQLLELSLGSGRLVLLTDAGIWNNRRLHYLDHARLLDELSADRARAWFISGMAVPTLPVWLWQQAWPLILAAALLLALWLWRRIPRQGPVLESARSGNRGFLNHLQAAGLLLWRRGDTDTLLAPLREEVRGALQRRGVPERHMEQHIVGHTGLEAGAIHEALTGRPREREELVAVISTLQTIRNRYGNH